MLFNVRFGIAGFVVLILLLITIPALVAIGGWLFREWRSAQTQLRQAQRQISPARPPSRGEEAYSTFVSTVSHQTSNALQAILGALSNLRLALLDPSPPPASGQDALVYIEQVEEQTRRLVDLMGNLRLLAQIEVENAPVAVQPVQVRAIIADVIMQTAEQAAAQGIELIYQGPSRPARVLANREQITLALQNLVDNSLKYARPESKEIVLSVSEEPDCLNVCVTDDGAGIPHTMLPHIFDAAYRAPDPRTRRQAGSGLGLAIVRRIVELHGGQVQVQSTYGQGTLVSFTLPRTPTSADD